MRLYLRGGSAQTILRAVTLRQNLQIKLCFSPSQRILAPSRPVAGAWQGSHWSANFEVTGMTRPRKNPGASWIRTALEADALTTRPTRRLEAQRDFGTLRYPLHKYSRSLSRCYKSSVNQRLLLLGQIVN